MSTNEEKRVMQYSNDSQPTVPATVTLETPVEIINLNWRENELPERERTKHVHRLHPYLGKFIPQLVEVFLRKYFQPGQTVLDPFAGSGTTLVQANELGINSVGFDISAFNVLLAGVKTAHYDLEQAEREVLHLLNKVKNLKRSDPLQLSLPLFDESEAPYTTDNEYLKKWYAPQALRELLACRDWIQEGDYKYQDLLKVILSRAARSARLTTHFDLDFPKKPQTEPYWCYKHSRMCSPTTDAVQFLSRYSFDTLKRIKEFARLRTDASVSIHNVDSRYGEITPIDGVITSPPYVGLIDYHEQHTYAYQLLGLRDQREHEIGPAKAGSSQKAKNRYQQDITDVFQNALQAMPSGGRMIVVAADKANLYDKIAQNLGVEIENIMDRHVNRRTGRRSGEFFEFVFVWRKV